MSNTTKGNSSDSTFYFVMLAEIIAMGFYISDDMKKRYGSEEAAADSNSNSEQNQTTEPVIVNIEKVISVEVKPVAEITAGEGTPQAVVVEKTVQETTTTTAIVPVTVPISEVKMPEAGSNQTSTIEVTRPAAAEKEIKLEDTVKHVVEPVKSAINSIPVESAATAVEAASTMMNNSVPVRQAAQEYQHYQQQFQQQYQQYGQPYQGGSFYQPQPYQPQSYQGQGGNYYQQPYNNPYSKQYNNKPYANPYDSNYNPGYNPGYNSYQQPQR